MIEVKAGYKQTEVGVIPEDWEVKPLGQISDVFMGQSPSGTTYNKNGEGVALINGPTEFTDVSPVKVQWTTQPTKICKADDLLICVRGSSTGRMNIADDEYCIGRGVAAIRAKSSSNTVYLTNQIHLGIEKLLTLSVGSTFPNIDGKSIRSIQIPLPPTLAEQTAIATVLSDTDTLIERLEKLIAKKIAIKQGAMQLLLAGKKRLLGFSGEWDVKKLGEVTEMYSGGTPLTSNNSYYGGQFPWVVIADMTKIKKYLFNTEKNITELGLENSSAKLFKKGTLLFAMYASIGKCAIIKVDVTCNQAILGINTKKIDIEFLYYYLAFNEQKFLQMGQAGTQNNLNKEIVQNLEIPYPSVEEQTAIAAILSDMDAEIESLEQTRNKYTMIKQGMMQQLLTGRIRIHGTH